MIELLAPAGDKICFLSAINSGADAIYIGMSDFSARKNAENFNSDNISYYVSYAHSLGVKVYVAINTLVKDDELSLLLKTVLAAYSANVDAFILQDIFLANLLKKSFPNIVLHLSTQAGVNEVGGALLAKQMGFSRVILARETPIEEIEKITKVIETEVFVHGALCTCFSGHCYMSAYVGGNSGNRGLCKQPCRKEYELQSSNLKGDYAISLSDLCLADEIKLLIEAGVSSFKIEGRMRSPEYVKEAVKLYRNAIDGKPYSLSGIKRTFNRGDYTKGYIKGVDLGIISNKIQNHSGEKVAKIERIVGDKIFVNRYCLKGDAFKIIANGFEVGNAICNVDGKALLYKGNAKVGYDLHLTKDSSLINLAEEKKLKRLLVKANVVEGDYLTLEAEGVSVQSTDKIDRALSSPLTKEEVINNLNKTDVYPFAIEADVNIKGSPFVAKSVLNKLRASLYEKVFFKDVKALKIPEYIDEIITNYSSSYKNIVLTDDYVEINENDAFVLHPNNYKDVSYIQEILKGVKSDKYLFVPSFLPQNDKDTVYELLQQFDGVYADGLSGIAIAKELNKKLIVGLGLNAFNKIDLDCLSKQSDAVVLSQELGQFEIDGNLNGLGHCFRFGSIRLMELIYCPFGKNCASCKRGYGLYTLTDKMGHRFKVRKYKISSSCRFEVYNEQALYADKRENSFINLIGIEKSTYKDYLQGNVKDIKSKLSLTNGNLKRGVN